jgi:hypothetical protein
MADSLKINVKGLEEVKRKLDPKGHDAVCMRALNKTATNVRAEGRRAIREQYNIKAKDVELNIERANRGTLKAVISASYKPLSLIKFGAKQIKKGLSVMITKGNKKIMKNTFIAQPTGRNWKAYGQIRQVNSPVAMVFQRGGKAKLFGPKRKKIYGNYPVDKLTGPSVGAMMKNDTVQERMTARAGEQLESNLAHELEYYMQGLFK